MSCNKVSVVIAFIIPLVDAGFDCVSLAVSRIELELQVLVGVAAAWIAYVSPVDDSITIWVVAAVGAVLRADNNP